MEHQGEHPLDVVAGRLDGCPACDAWQRFKALGNEIPPSAVPALVRAGRTVWSFGYGDDDDFTVITPDDLWAWDMPGETGDALIAGWAPFRLAP